MSKQAKRDTRYLQKALVKSYVDQFDDSLSKCAPDTEKMVNRSIVHLSEEDTFERSKMLVNNTLSESEHGGA